MRIITRNGIYTKDGEFFPRMEPWTTDQEVPDDIFDHLPPRTVVTVPPAGYRYVAGVTADDMPTPDKVVREESKAHKSG